MANVEVLGIEGKTNHYISGRLAEAFECSASGKTWQWTSGVENPRLYGTIPNDRDVFSWNTVPSGNLT